MDKINFRKKIKRHLFKHDTIGWMDTLILFLILTLPTLILLSLNLVNMVPIVLLTEIFVYNLVNQKLPIELLIKLIFLIIILFTFSIFSAAISSYNSILLLSFTVFWFGIYTFSRFFGKLTNEFGLLSILYFLITSLNLTVFNVNTFETWLLSILSTIFSGFLIVVIKYLKNDDAICISMSNCFKLDNSLSELFRIEELASEFSNKKLISLIEIAKDIKLSKLNIDFIKSNLDLDVLIAFEDIIQETDRLTYIIKHNLSKNNYNFNISLKKFESKLKFLYRFKEQNTDITEVISKSEELFAIFQRAESILKNEFNEEYIVPNLTSNIYVTDIIKSNLNLDNIYIQNFIRFTLASILLVIILVLTNNYNFYNTLFALILLSLTIKANISDDTLIYGYLVSMLLAICLSLVLSMFSVSNWILLLIIFLICLMPSFKNNILVKDFIFIAVLMLIQINTLDIMNILNYGGIWLIISLISLFVSLIIYPHITKINLYDALSFKLKTNFNFVFEVLLSQNLNEYSTYWSKVSIKNNEFESALNTVVSNYVVTDDIILRYGDISACIDAITLKSLAFNTHVEYDKSEEWAIILNLIKKVMDEILSNLDNNSKMTDVRFKKIYSRINKFKKNCDDKKSVLALDYLLWIVYDWYILSIFLDDLRLNKGFIENMFIY